MKDSVGKTAAMSPPGTATGARLEGAVPGDPFLMISDLDLGAAGYVREEWFLEGTANAYSLDGERRTGAGGSRRRRALPSRLASSSTDPWTRRASTAAWLSNGST